MHLHGIRANGKRRYKVTTDGKHDLRIAPNQLDRQFTPVEPDKAWGDAITSFAAYAGWLFLAVAIDLFRRRVTGQARKETIASLLWCKQNRLHSTPDCLNRLQFERERLAARATHVNS